MTAERAEVVQVKSVNTQLLNREVTEMVAGPLQESAATERNLKGKHLS